MNNDLPILFSLTNVLVCCIISCSTNEITNYEHNKLGFTILTGDWDDDSTLTVEIRTDRSISPLPSITVNGHFPDETKNYTDYYGFEFNKIKYDTFFSYQIIYKNDTVHDDVFIPGIIDSLFLNGSYISPTFEENHLSFSEDTDSLHLYWKDNKKTNYYRLDLSSHIGIHNSFDFIGDYDATNFTSDTSMSFYIDWKRKDFNGSTSIIIYKLNSPNLYKNPTANLSSKSMFVYYFIKGPSYYAWRYIEKQE